jgi:microcystin degradation protein MlrC
MGEVMDEREAAEPPASIELAFCFGFPYADFADLRRLRCAVYADDAGARADARRRRVPRLHQRQRGRFPPRPQVPADVAVREADGHRRQRRPSPSWSPDTQDNPGGGGHGDTTGLLAEFIRQGAAGVVFALINDAESADACHRAGDRRPASPSPSAGKSDGMRRSTSTATVENLTDGRFVRHRRPWPEATPPALGPIRPGRGRPRHPRHRLLAQDPAL